MALSPLSDSVLDHLRQCCVEPAQFCAVIGFGGRWRLKGEDGAPLVIGFLEDDPLFDFKRRHGRNRGAKLSKDAPGEGGVLHEIGYDGQNLNANFEPLLDTLNL
jgi:hypothetical protein